MAYDDAVREEWRQAMVCRGCGKSTPGREMCGDCKGVEKILRKLERRRAARGQKPLTREEAAGRGADWMD